MKTVYIDPITFECHTNNPAGAYEEVKTCFFDGKCDTFIEGFRHVPENKIWIDSDGAEFSGPMYSAWKNYPELAAAQAQYEADLAEAAVAYQEGVDSV